MKTVVMIRDYYYRPFHSVVIHYIGGATYPRVPEAAVQAIVKAKAGTPKVDE